MSEHTTAVAIQSGPEPVMTAEQLIARSRVIEQVFKTVMKEYKPPKDGQPGVEGHYGKIPGCGDKPALLKAGAEKLMATFGISAEIRVTDLSVDDEVRYRVESRATSIASGAYLGSGVGECSSNEEKYRWRKATTDKEFEFTPEDRRRVKWGRGKGGEYEIRQVRTNPADVANTVLKMSAKRARIDMVLTVLGCSDMFQQDLDEDDVAEQARENRAEQATEKKADKPKGDIAVIFVVGVTEKAGTYQAGNRKGQPFTKYGIDGGQGTVYSSFDKAHGELGRQAQAEGFPVQITYTVNGQYTNITEMTRAHESDRAPGVEG